MIANKFKGFFWHVHHDVLVEWSGDIRERIAYVKREKLKKEVATRLRLMRKVKGKLPPKVVKAYKKRSEAYKKWSEANKKRSETYKKWSEAYKKRSEAEKKWSEADTKCNEAYKKCDEAYKKRSEAYKKWSEAYKKRSEAEKKWSEAYKKRLPELEKLHKEECGCLEWVNGQLVFGKEVANDEA